MPTIALVDDDRNILTSVSIALEAEEIGISPMHGTVKLALDGFKSAPPDLAILDIKMPRMDGMETLLLAATAKSGRAGAFSLSPPAIAARNSI